MLESNETSIQLPVYQVLTGQLVHLVVRSLCVKRPIRNFAVRSQFVQSFNNIQNICSIACNISKLKFFIRDITVKCLSIRAHDFVATCWRQGAHGARTLTPGGNNFHRYLSNYKWQPLIFSKASQGQTCSAQSMLFHLEGSIIELQ